MAKERSGPPGDEPLLVVDGAGTVRRWSERAQRVFGLSDAEALGRSVVWATSSREVALRVRPRLADGKEDVPDVQDARGAAVGMAAGGRAGVPLYWTVELAADEPAEPESVVWDEAVLEALFGQSPVGLHVLDTDLRVVSVSSGTSATRERPPGGFTGRRFDEVYRLADPAAQEAVARQILATGVPAVERTVRGYEDEERTRERLYSVSGFRLHGADGRVLGLALVVVDRTERERAKVLAELLATERESVGRTLDVVATCQDLADTLAPGFADRAEVEIADSVVRGAEPPSPDSVSPPLLRCAAVAGVPLEAGGTACAGDRGGPSRDADAPSPPKAPHGGGVAAGADGAHRTELDEGGPGVRGRAGEVRSLHGPSPETLALADLQPRLLDLRAGAALPDSAKRAPHGAHSLLVVPLALRGGALGLLTLYRVGRSEPYLTDEVATAVEIAAHAALAVDNARRYAHERALAATVQRRLLPQRSTDPPLGVRTAHTYLPGTAGGGAWYDVIPLSGACSAFVVGEVAGQGIHAATAMGQVRTAVRAFATLGIEPDELLARLDETVSQLAAERRALPAHDQLRDEPLTVACVYAVYDAGDGSCTAARAGGADPWLAGPDGVFTPLGAPEGPALGDPDVAPFASVTTELPEGSTLMMSASPEARVGPILRETTASGSVQDVCDALALAGDTARADGDTVFLATRTTGLSADTAVSWPLDLGKQAPARARARAGAWLSERVGGEAAFRAELIVSELVTNAVRYGTPPLSLGLILGRVLTVEVKDASPTSPHLRHARTLDEGGRGLFIVAQMADRWGTRPSPRGKTIWAETSRD
ncbi:SpoIIE family protein phosphatase [Streptomyces sp. 8L]|uniref:SpoIIE family protein phosphatase n=1 Tax=Streptomyces sp. 8L TaxID=2877242 RepID=UPI001CD4A593|nr:SpoIIE family protein phosphatase [Streptomyces sp. 8L]MCA1222131.1 SpoIIE family protein phosphatase [Streptomyces sp. 8L]